MANRDTPYGLKPRYPNKAKTSLYYIDSSAGNIFKGDPVKLENDGAVAPGAEGNRIIGVAAAFLDSNKHAMATPYHVTGTAGYAIVYDDPAEEFIVQCNSATVAPAQTHVGNMFDIEYTSGNTTTGQSKCELEFGAVPGASTPAQCIVKQLAPGFDCPGGANAWGSWAKVIVQIEQHQLAASLETGV
ncbi:MAG: hypothetical protein Q6361_03040 [Candidatus Hermodarchaeota archaeon]|nr:hypothetical protein [Candidatus Hermodarchaeota archaeon]